MSNKNLLEMPSSYAVMDTEEMMYLDGGLNIGMNRGYLDKNICLDQARGVIRTYNWKNVTAEQLQREIYGHAVVYYKWSVLQNIPYLDEKVYSHVADGVDLDDQVDRYQWVWDNVTWRM
ncbi:MAG TPA: hypothetical protein DCW90_11955 [Lachnospiraceae bacterium]|nr:hypothetical protein [uncultured Lachnoclostridium sp.]HAU86169.1 hypothetical protein [Lachnospiraceae bacterium]